MFDLLFLSLFIVCRRENRRFDVPLRWIKPLYFLSKNGDDVACEEENVGKSVDFSQELAFF